MGGSSLHSSFAGRYRKDVAEEQIARESCVFEIWEILNIVHPFVSENGEVLF